MTIKGLLFDLDGTLLDRDASLLSFVEDQYERLAELHHVEKQQYVEAFLHLDQRGYVWKDKVYQQLIESFHLPLSWEYLLEDYVEGFQHHCIGFPNLHELLQLLKNNDLKLGMITNGFDRFQMNNIEALGIKEYFDAILISEREGLRKPDPAIFERASKKLNVMAEETIFVGDHPIHDVAASRAVGMQGWWKEDRVAKNKVACDYVIQDLLDVYKYLETGATKAIKPSDTR